MLVISLVASIGTALLNTIAVSATASYLAAGHPAGLTTLALLHGYTTAFWWSAGILAAGAVICGTLLRRGPLAGQGDSGQAGPHDPGATGPLSAVRDAHLPVN
jgi:hypothetical protein